MQTLKTWLVPKRKYKNNHVIRLCVPFVYRLCTVCNPVGLAPCCTYELESWNRDTLSVYAQKRKKTKRKETEKEETEGVGGIDREKAESKKRGTERENIY